MPLNALYAFSDVTAYVIRNLIGYRREVVRKNLKSVFPDKDEEELRLIEKQFYHHLCNVVVEAIKLAHVSDREIMRRIEFSGVEMVNESLAEGKSVILMLGHYGNWEWVTSSAMKYLPGTISCEIYHPLRDKAIDRLMLELRSRFGTENIPMSRTVRQLLQFHKEGLKFVCGFISDQRPFSPELKHWTEFMGIDTAYVTGAEAIGNKIGADFFYVEMMPLRRGHYRMNFSRLEPLNDGEKNPVSRAFLQSLEKSIRKNPSCWLWSHNRWKRKRELK